MCWRWPLASVVLLPKPITPGSAGKSTRPIPTEGHPSHCLARPAQTSEVIKNKQSLRHCRRPEAPTETWQPDGRGPRGHPGTGKRISDENHGNLNLGGLRSVMTPQCWVASPGRWATLPQNVNNTKLCTIFAIFPSIYKYSKIKN